MNSAIFTYQARESTIDFEGHISVLLFTRGCNFRCRYCHNNELLEFGGPNLTYEKLDAVLERAKQNWADAACITGGEPCAHANLPETAAFIKSKKLALKLDTNGSFPQILKEAAPYCDYIAMDYKMPAKKYTQIAGTHVNIDSLHESIEFLKSSGVQYELRTTIVPTIHTEEDMRAICHELSGVRRLALQSFVPRTNLPDSTLTTVSKTPHLLLESFAEICKPYFEEVIVR